MSGPDRHLSWPAGRGPRLLTTIPAVRLFAKPSPRPLRILSIDGGGIRGLIPARIIQEVEERAERPAGELFDLIAGTSTGALIALGLACPKSEDGGVLSGEDLVKTFRHNARRIFPRSFLRRTRVRRYATEPMSRVISTYLGSARLSDARTDVMIPAYDLERRAPFFFKSWRARREKSWDFSVTEAAQAACAAPGYFEPVRLEAKDGRRSSYSLIDGGVFANNPTLCAIVEARKRDPTRQLQVVSLGTGGLKRRIPHEEAKDWTIVQWAKRGFEIVSDGVSDAVAYHAATISGVDHIRFQADLPPSALAMDNGDPGNLNALLTAAQFLINKRSDVLDQISRPTQMPD